LSGKDASILNVTIAATQNGTADLRAVIDEALGIGFTPNA
jgi:hypothetical protein